MYQFVSVLVILVSILLILIVLVQNSKGGGLASNFSASNQVMGVRKTADFLEKATWTLAASLLVLSLVAVMVLPGGSAQSGSAIDEEIQNLNLPTQELPNFGIGEGETSGTEATSQDSL